MLRRILGAMGLGAGMMYLFDPELGTRRRTELRDKTIRWRRDLTEATESVMQDLQTRSHSLLCDVRAMFGNAQAAEQGRGSGGSQQRTPQHGSQGTASHPPTSQFLWGTLGAALTLHGLATRCLTSSLLGTIALGTTAASISSASIQHGGSSEPQRGGGERPGGRHEEQASSEPRKLILPGGGPLPEITGTQEHPGTMAAEALENSRIGVPTSHASKSPLAVGINPG